MRRHSLLRVGLWLSLLLLCFAALRISVLNVARVTSGSMLPTAETGDFILIHQLAWGLNLPFRDTQSVQWGMPERGAIVLFHNPHDAGNVWMKRVVGLPGDRLEFREHRLYVNGIACTQQRRFEQLPRSANAMTAPYRIWHSSVEADWGPVLVGEASMFVMGDNRGASMDSRRWGPVPLAYLLGKPVLHLWPLPMLGMQPGLATVAATDTNDVSDDATRISDKEVVQ